MSSPVPAPPVSRPSPAPVPVPPRQPPAPSPSPAPTSPPPHSHQSAPAPDRRHPPPDVPTAPRPPSPHPLDPGDIIEMDTFTQILDLDEDDDEFSKGMVWAYFSQVSETFQEMDAAYDKKDLPKLSALGHFLKGSSAALGVAKVRDSCEQVQHYGDLRDEQAGSDLLPADALAKIGVTLQRVKVEYAAAESWLKSHYAKSGPV